MNKLLVCFALILTVSVVKSQALSENEIRKNHVKVNLLAIPFADAEIGYERYLNAHSSIGISAWKNLNKIPFNSNSSYVEYVDLIQNLRLRLQYRMYFGKKSNQGFFLEADMVALMREGIDRNNSTEVFPSRPSKKNFLYVGLGIVTGLKKNIGKRMFVEAEAGVYRILNQQRGDVYYDWDLSVSRRLPIASVNYGIKI